MASVYYPGCTTDPVPFYSCDPCATREKSRVRSAFFVTDAYYATLMADPLDIALWQAGIESEDIIIVPKTTGTLEISDPVTGPGYGDDLEEVLGVDFTLNWRDPNYKGNCNFYNTLSKKTGFYHIGYRTGSQTAISTETVSLNVKAPITENLEDNVEWQGRARWRSQEQPCPFDTPEGIFECFALAS